MSELEDISPPNCCNNDPFSWLATQNKELRDHNKKLANELYDWKLNASETNERLSRVYQNRNKQNYVDSFYDSNMKRLLKSFAQENVLLKKELSIKDDSNRANKLLEQRNTIQTLKENLESTCQENKQLTNEMENLKCSDAITELKRNFLDLKKTQRKVSVENTDLKNQMKNHDEIMSYLKSEFGKQRKEFVKLFIEHYLYNGVEFIEQLKSLDGDEIPDFLKKPLQSEADELITDPLPTTNLFDSNKDSGIDSLPDVFQDLMTKCRELEEAKTRVTHLEDDLRCKMNREIEMKKLLTSCSDKNRSLEFRIKMLEGNAARSQKELSNANDDALSWKTALQQLYHSDMQHRQSYPFESDTQEYRKRKTQNLVKEPYEAVKWCTNPQAVLVRDSPAKTSDSHYPTESQDVSKYTPRGPLSFSPSEMDISTCSTLVQEKKKSTENESASSGVSLGRNLLFIQCETCKKDIEYDRFDEHGRECGIPGKHDASK